MPRQQVAGDDFNRADGALAGPNWQQATPGSGSVVIADNVIRGNNAYGDYLAAGWVSHTFGDDQYAEIDVAPNGLVWGEGNNIGLALRWDGQVDGSRSLYELLFGSFPDIELRITRVQAGSRTVLASVPYEPGGAFRLEGEAEGTTLRLLVNGAVQLTATDAALTSGRPGVVAKSGSDIPRPLGDNWSAGNIVPAGGGSDMAIIQFKRGTRAQIDTAAGASQLRIAEPYLLTDEGRMALGLAANSYADLTMRGVDLPVCWPIRTATPKVAGDIGATALTTLAVTSSRQYWVPVVVARKITLTALRISVTTASAGLASVGLYSNRVASGSDEPNQLLASATGLDTGTTGDKTGSISYTLQPGVLYWASLICAAAATLRAMAVGSIQPALGRTVNGTTMISHLYAAGSGSTLASPAPATFTAGTGSTPAIYLVGT
jgi:hypothetical protein